MTSVLNLPYHSYPSDDSSGFNSDLLINEPNEELLCPICREVARDIRVCPAFEGHIFCKSCINSHLDRSHSCPLCRSFTTSDSLKTAPQLDEVVNCMELKCPNSFESVGWPACCAWTGKISTLSSHLSECLFQPVRCPYIGCTTYLPRHEMDAHAQVCENESKGLRHNNSGYQEGFSHLKKEFPRNELEKHFNLLIDNTDAAVQLKGIRYLRQELSLQRQPKIKEVVDLGAIPVFCYLLEEGSPELQFEAAWTLTNIASGDSIYTKMVAESESVPTLVSLVQSENEDLSEQSCWALGNVAGDSSTHRDLVFSHGVVDAVKSMLESNPNGKVSKVRTATWMMSNLCKGKPGLQLVRPLFPQLVNLLSNEDQETMRDACWAFAYISDGDSTNIQSVIETNVVTKIVSMLRNSIYPQVVSPALRVLGNLVTGDDVQTQHVLDMDALSVIVPLLGHSKKTVKKEAAWVLSNITAGNSEQIQLVIDSGCFSILEETFMTSESDIQKEMTWLIANATSGGSYAQICSILQHNTIQLLLPLLRSGDLSVKRVVLEFVEKILAAGEKENQQLNSMVPLILKEESNLSMIEECAKCDNFELQDRANNILTEYFSSEHKKNSIILSSSSE